MHHYSREKYYKFQKLQVQFIEFVNLFNLSCIYHHCWVIKTKFSALGLGSFCNLWWLLVFVF